MRFLISRYYLFIKFVLVCLVIISATSYFSLPVFATYPSRPMPNWWRQEYIRRQRIAYMQRWEHVRSTRMYQKQMVNPRSPQFLAYQRTFNLSHKQLKPVLHTATMGKADRKLHG